MSAPEDPESIVKKLISSIHSIEGRIVLIEQKFTDKIRNIDGKVSELEDLTKEFLGEDDDDNEAGATETPKAGTDMEEFAGREDEDFFKSTERKKDNEKHAKFCPYIVPSPLVNAPEPVPVSELSGIPYIRQYIYFLFHDEKFNIVAWLIFIGVMILIFISTVAYVLETIPALETHKIWDVLEAFVSIAFTVEYLMRIIVVRNRLEYALVPLNMVDFLAVIPWYLEIGLGFNGAILRMIRVIRLARISRLRTSASVSEYIEVMKATLEKTAKESFGMLAALLFLEIIVFSSLIYVAEKDADHPGQGNQFNSIPSSSWWCVVTITTVGYGDMFPTTTWGKIIGTVTTFTGLIVMAIFVIIIGGNFEKIYKDYQRKKRKHKHLQKLRHTKDDLS